MGCVTNRLLLIMLRWPMAVKSHIIWGTRSQNRYIPTLRIIAGRHRRLKKSQIFRKQESVRNSRYFSKWRNDFELDFQDKPHDPSSILLRPDDIWCIAP
jgi:hypothetical protein